MSEEKYGIYIAGSGEKWFDISFDSEERAKWFADMQDDLNPDDYEIKADLPKEKKNECEGI